MRKSILFLLVITFLGAVLFFWEDLLKELPRIKTEVPVLVQEIRGRIATPPPLILEDRFAESFLTQAGVIQQTNIQREKYGLPPLKESAKLNLSAQIKTQDMLDKQYFGHVSPAGEGVGDLAGKAGYEFIAIGENLALGDFENDEKLVQGWMASQGHRENILSSQYQEIGVAVLKGEFEGRVTWLAVQHFGLPLSSCPQPPESTQAAILTNQQEIQKMSYVLSLFQNEIRAMQPKRGSIYNQKVKEYNALVFQYNTLIDATKLLIEQYNNQVILFNECAKG